MSYQDATRSLQLIVIVATVVFVTIGIDLARRRKAEHGRFSIVPILLAVAVNLLFIALAHLILGGQLPDTQRHGLWSDGTLTAFPTSFAALGGLLSSTWAVLWSAENTANETESSAVRAEAETRRQQVAELRALLARLEREFAPILEVWVGPGANRSGFLWDLIKNTWTDLLASGSGLVTPASDGECQLGHEVAVPDINMFVPKDEAGSIDLGCPHFQEAIYTRLPELERVAETVAVNKTAPAQEVRAIRHKIIPLLERYGLPVRALLDDTTTLCSIYPHPPPSRTTPEGRRSLADALYVTYVLNEHQERWDQEFMASAHARGLQIAPPRNPRRKIEIAQGTTTSVDARATLSRALKRCMDEDDRALGAGSRVQFWRRIAREIELGAGSIDPRDG